MKPSLKKYRRYAHRCQPLSPTFTDEEKNVHLASSTTPERGRGKKPRSISTPPLLKGMKWMFGKKNHKGSVKSCHNEEEDLAEKGIQIWDANTKTNRDARVSGTAAKKGSTSSTVRRRATNNSEQRRTSAFLGSEAATTVNTLIFGGTEKFERLKKANRDLEAACETCEDEAEIDGNVESQRGSSMPSMHLRPHSQRANIMATGSDAPIFTHIFDPPAGGVQAWQDQVHVGSVQSKIHHDVQVRPAKPMTIDPSLIFNEPAPSACTDTCTADPRDFTFDSTSNAILDLLSLGRLDEVSERRTLHDYESEDAMYDGQMLRNVTTTSTDSGFVDAPFLNRDSRFQCHDATSHDDRPLDFPICDDYDWEIASREMQPSQDFCTVSPCIARSTECPKTPDRRFPLRHPKYRHSISRYSHNDLENIPPIEDHIQPFYTPFPACRGSKQQRARRKTMQPLSPLPNYSASKCYGANGDTLDIPRKRRWPPKRPPLYHGLDGAADERDSEEQQPRLNINDLRSTSRVSTSGDGNPPASNSRAECANDDRRRPSGFTGLAGLMEVKATAPSPSSRTDIPMNWRKYETVAGDATAPAVADDTVAPSASSPSRTRSALYRSTPSYYAEREEENDDDDDDELPTPAPNTSSYVLKPSTMASHSPKTSSYLPAPPSNSVNPSNNLSPSPSPSPSSIRYSSAHLPHSPRSQHSETMATAMAASFRSQSHSQSPKRRFSGPAGCERQRRRLRRVGTGMGTGMDTRSTGADRGAGGILEKRVVDRGVDEDREEDVDGEGTVNDDREG